MLATIDFQLHFNPRKNLSDQNRLQENQPIDDSHKFLTLHQILELCQSWRLVPRFGDLISLSEYLLNPFPFFLDLPAFGFKFNNIQSDTP